jgi:hypothetical protein
MFEFCCGVFTSKQENKNKANDGDADMGNGQSIEMTDNPGFYDASEHQMVAEPVVDDALASNQPDGK